MEYFLQKITNMNIFVKYYQLQVSRVGSDEFA